MPGRDAVPFEEPTPFVVSIEPAAQEIKAEPAPAILVPRLPRDRRRGKHPAQILGMQEARVRDVGADGAHREQDSPALIDDGAQKRPLIAAVRMPVPVEAGEASRRQRLVDRRPCGDLRVARRGTPGVGGEPGREGGREQLGSARSGTVMQKSGDRRESRAGARLRTAGRAKPTPQRQGGAVWPAPRARGSAAC